MNAALAPVVLAVGTVATRQTSIRRRAPRARGVPAAAITRTGVLHGASPAPAPPGTSAEDYLVGIAALSEGGEPVTGARLAALLGVSEPSVTQMVQRLAQVGLALRRQRHTTAAWPGIRLTAAGAEAATWLLQRRRVCECFFVDAIGLDWATAQQAADQMEHGLSREAVHQLHAGLGRPTTCPHGNRLDLNLAVGVEVESVPGLPAAPSAGAGGRPECTALDRPDSQAPPPAGRQAVASTATATAPPVLPLTDAPAGARVVVAHLLGPIEQDPAALRYCQQGGLLPGQALVVDAAVPEAGMLTVRRGRRQCVVPERLAAGIRVRAPSARRSPGVPPPATALPLPCRPDGTVQLTAVRVEGPCSSGHRAGDRFVMGDRTPAGLCGASYAALLPQVRRMLAAADVPAVSETFERRCPGDGYVVWRLERLDTHALVTQPAPPSPPLAAPPRHGVTRPGGPRVPIAQ